MKLIINTDRSVIPVGTWGTVNENNYEILEFEFPAELEHFNKRIVYYLGDKKVWDAIVNNKAYITNAITTKEHVNAYVWLTKNETITLKYVCDGTEEGNYYFTYDNANYYFTMPEVEENDELIFDVATSTLKLDNTTIATTSTGTGTELTFETIIDAEEDFRTQLFEMQFYENENADGIVPTEQQVDGFNTMLTAMNAKIDEVDALEQTIETAEAERQEAEATRVSNENTRESNESTRQENEQTRQSQEAERERRTDKAIADIKDKTAEYNQNAQEKTEAFNTNASQKTNDFNNNYTQKVNDFNSNASSKELAFNSNAESKTSTFNTNATNKTNDFNSNASSKTTAFNENATSKTNTFNSNANDKTSAFNDNATQKTTDFNNNASEKTDEFNNNAQEKIDEYDEHIVEYQAQIDDLQNEVEELSENMPWNTTEQATEISVDDAAKYSRNKLELFGNTEQTQYTGVQLLDISDAVNGYFTNDAGDINNSYDGFRTQQYIDVESNTSIYGRFEALDNIRLGRFYVQEYNENKKSIKRHSIGIYDSVFTLGQVRKWHIDLSEGTKYIRLSGYVIRVIKNEEEIQIKPTKDYWNDLVKATISFTDVDIYEPYVGGQPSPNPDYPQDIHVVTGENIIHVLKPGEVVLPSNYTQLDYIRSTGTQWIDTEYKPNNNTKIEVLGQNFKLGADSGWYAKSFDIAGTPFSFGNTGGNIPLTGNKELITMENGKVKSSTYQRTFNLQNFQCEYNLVLFAINRNANIIEKSYDCKIYSCKLWENNTLVRDFIPCKNPNNEIGLYDMVSQTFFANQGTGNFVAGNEIHHADYPINLGSIELCKIGNYQDYLYKENGNWYKYRNVGKIIYDGTEGWSIRAFSDSNYLSLKRTLGVGENGGYCNNFISNDSYSVVMEHITLSKQWQECAFAILKSRLSTATATGFKNWLSEHNTTVYYILATPTTTQITDTTLIAQLEAIYNHLALVKGTNNITVTAADLAPYMKLSYMQDLPAKLDNLDSRLSLLE